MAINWSSISKCNWYDLARLSSILENRLEACWYQYYFSLHIHMFSLDPWVRWLLLFYTIYHSPNIPDDKTTNIFGKISPQVPKFSVINKKESRKMLKVLRKFQCLQLVSAISTCARPHVCESNPRIFEQDVINLRSAEKHCKNDFSCQK